MPRYHKTCTLCGAHIDPGERCDCKGPVEVYLAGRDDYVDEIEDVYGKEEAACFK